MWFLSKIVDQKNKEEWIQQACINGNIFDALENCSRHIDALSKRISDLEDKLSSQPKIVLCDDKERNAKLKKASKSMSTTDAIIGIVEFAAGGKLHYTRIYDTLKQIKPNVKLQSVKAILYQLARQNEIRLCNGTETGLYFIEKK